MLIVEDSPIVRERLVTLIAELGNVVIVDQADVGAQALSLFRLHRPTAVVLDIDLPDLDGLELLVEFKLENPHCIVLMLSTLATDDFIRRRCQALGADYCFDKYMEFERALDVLGRLNIN